MVKKNFTGIGLAIHILLLASLLVIFVMFLVNSDFLPVLNIGIGVAVLLMTLNFGIIRIQQHKKKASIIYFSLSIIPLVFLVFLLV